MGDNYESLHKIKAVANVLPSELSNTFSLPCTNRNSRCDTESTVQLSALGFFQFQLLKASQAYSGCNY